MQFYCFTLMKKAFYAFVVRQEWLIHPHIIGVHRNKLGGGANMHEHEHEHNLIMN